MMITRWALVAVCLTLASDSLRAEPITWNYSSDYTNLQNRGGSLPLNSWSGIVLTGAESIHSEGAATVSNRPAGLSQGSKVLTIGEAKADRFFEPFSDSFNNTPSSFTFEFHLQDVKSGQQGTAHFTGNLSETHRTLFEPPFPWYDRKLSFNSIDPIDTWLASTTLRLGANDYHVDLKQRKDLSGSAFIDADVRVETAATPEPSTILMGGIGLVGMGLGWLRKKRLAKS